MKYIILFLISLSILTPQTSRADFPEFEPSMLCIAGAVGGYVTSKTGDEMTYAGLGCAVGYFVGYMINDHYKNKYTEKNKKELEDAQKVIDGMIQAQAEAADPETAQKTGWYKNRVKVVRGGRMPNGSIRKPTLEVELISPAMTDDVNIRFGK